MRVAARDLGVTGLARRGRVPQEVGDVVLVDVRRPEPCGEGVPQIMEAEIGDPGLFDRPFKTDHQLTTLSARALRVKDKLIVGRVLPQALQDFERPRS